MWYFKVTRADGRMRDVGPYSSEEDAVAMASDYATNNPGDTVGDAEEKEPGYVALAPKAESYDSDGTKRILYNDGSIINVS